MKRWLIGAGLIIVIGAIIAFNFLRKEKGIEVTTEKVKKGIVQQVVTGSGQIKPAVEVKVSAQVAGKIIALYAKEGDRVRRGQLLVALDPQQYKASVERAESSLMAGKANEKKALSELKRSRELYQQHLISEAEYEAAEANYESALSARMQAEASLKEAKDALSKTKLYATMNGVVTRLNKEQGEMAIGAQFQEDVIMVISDLSIMEAVIEVDENDVVNVSIGDSADVELDAFQDTVFHGVVTEIANSAITKGLGTQEQVTNFEVTIRLDNPDKRFRPGMSTTVDIKTKRLDDVVRVPIQAVTVREKSRLQKKQNIEEHQSEAESSTGNEEMQEVVFIVENGHAIARPIKLGISDDTHYAVLSGLEEGEEVITGPFKILNKTLNDQDLVEVKKRKKGKRNAD
ncbi:MAG TPA: efflux RND transporter periplasmic adaptor subunit [Calditrichaeota bacterium]|nr:efflux RND transporter periplasmic adaptor subunit [Calditrichota bacterium]